MKKQIILLLVLSFIVSLNSCEDAEMDTSTDNCENRAKWLGFDEACGCYGESIGFMGYCVTSFQEGDVPYFGYVNYGHIKDSILVVLRKSKETINVKTVSDFPSLDSKQADLDWYLTRNRPIQLLYYDVDWNNPDALGRGTELRLDPKVILQEPEQFTIDLYQTETRVIGSTILDSASFVVTKDMNRK